MTNIDKSFNENYLSFNALWKTLIGMSGNHKKVLRYLSSMTMITVLNYTNVNAIKILYRCFFVIIFVICFIYYYIFYNQI